ncbi:GNAT family N-acetyltransferase [Methylomonas koyamae]|uniref:GNAT family N-acetyltransferase n=1 Tax=Methylomonas koyamae TaxID=702114 RepID=UPI001C33D10C|nr:GNAT family N-acetyltransferase [Methylomonas koyamae]BBL60303.1 hypothetical protein MKFW12EY_39160 [Methylomonas koyamae]
MPETVTDTADPFQFRTLQPEDIGECIRIAIANFDEFRDHPQYISQWFERRIVHNPWQSSLPGPGVGVWHGSRLIGFRAMFAQPWWLNGKSTVIAFCANTSVDQQYRGKGLATQLISETKNFSAITGSVTAGDITQKAYRKLDYLPIGGESNDFFRLRIGYRGSWEKRVGKTMGRILGGAFDLGLSWRDRKLYRHEFVLEETGHCGAEFDSLWDSAKAAYPSCLERSSRYLNWRLFEFPTCPLQLLALRDSNGELRAYAIWHRQSFADSVSMAVLRDVFYLPQDEPAIRGLLYHVFAYWRKNGISWGNLEVATPRLTALFKELGYEALGSHGNRYQIYSNPPLPDAVLSEWYRSGIDGDYFDHPL